MDKSQVQQLEPGIYKVYFTQEAGGGSTLAAIGNMEAGFPIRTLGKWIAPLTWTKPALRAKIWDLVVKVEPVTVATGIAERAEEKLVELRKDERLKYPAANVLINAPLALVQTDLKAQVNTLEWLLKKPFTKLPKGQGEGGVV